MDSRTRLRLLLLLSSIGLGLGAACAHPPSRVPYTIETDLAYGEDPAQRGDLYRWPLDPAGASRPAVMLIHGGSWARGDRSYMRDLAERFAESGFVVWNVEYRLAPEHHHPAQVEDVRTALAWLHGRAAEFGVAPDRIAVMGYSAGGHLALLLGLTRADRSAPPAAVASGAGPTDLRAYPESPVIRRLLGGRPDEKPEAWTEASPIVHASSDDPPVFLYHGRLDRIVGIEQSRRLAARLRDLGVASRLVEEPLSGHFTTFLFDGDSFREARSFFEEHLR